MEEAAHVFERARPRLQSLAYRMLGSRAEAEDVVQDTWLRLQAAPEPLASPDAWLTTVTTRLSLDALRRAKAERERYVGPWLPEPVDDPTWLDAGPGGPEWATEQAQSVSLAFMVVLETLSPLERAAYLLHHVFGFEHADVAAMLERTPAAVRQLCHRAEAHVAEKRPRFAPTADAHRRLLGAFAVAMATGDVAAVERLLVAEAVVTSDGGGVRRAARRRIVGSSRAARFLASVARKSPLRRVSVRDVNGAPSLVWETMTGDRGVLGLETDGGRVCAVQLIVNPAKLGRLAPP